MLRRSALGLALAVLIATALVTACNRDASPRDQVVSESSIRGPVEQEAPLVPAVQAPPPAPAARAPMPAAPPPPAVSLQVSDIQPRPTATLVPTVTPEPARAPGPTTSPVPTETPAPTPDHRPAPTALPTQELQADHVLTPKPPASPSPVPAHEPDTQLPIEGAGDRTLPIAVTLDATAPELTTVEVVKTLKPSIVQIVSELAAMGVLNTALPPTGVGTGVILDQEGHILTNNHVVEDSQGLTVTLEDGSSFPAEIVGRDVVTDLAVIRIQADGLQPAKLGVSSEIQVGEDVIAIGHALGLSGGPTVSKGVISALGRSIDADQNFTFVDLIQTDASINPGNSGGALVNTEAEVIGINTAIIEGGRGIGFAINIDDAKVVAQQLMDHGFVRRGFLGITPVNLTPAIAAQLGLDATEGVIVAKVLPDTAAAGVPLLAEDVIVGLGGQTIRNTGELSKFLIAHLPGETVDIVVLRDGGEVSAQLTLGERPD